MIRYCNLGSGSTGNATLVEASDGLRTTRVLLDCGFSQRELAQRLGRMGIAVEQIDAVFVTHEHGDHVGCAVALARRHRLPLWTSRGTFRAVAAERLASGEWPEADEGALDGLVRYARDGVPIDLGALRLLPYTVPHDAREPLQVVFTDGARRLGVLTDAGASTPHILAQLAGCDALLLECNHDPDLLAASPYPASVRARIAGRLGHLSNAAAAEILAACRHGRLRHVAAAHLSERNNTPLLARAALAAAWDHPSEAIRVADPKLGLDWLELA